MQNITMKSLCTSSWNVLARFCNYVENLLMLSGLWKGERYLEILSVLYNAEWDVKKEHYRHGNVCPKNGETVKSLTIKKLLLHAVYCIEFHRNNRFQKTCWEISRILTEKCTTNDNLRVRS